MPRNEWRYLCRRCPCLLTMRIATPCSFPLRRLAPLQSHGKSGPNLTETYCCEFSQKSRKTHLARAKIPNGFVSVGSARIRKTLVRVFAGRPGCRLCRISSSLDPPEAAPTSERGQLLSLNLVGQNEILSHNRSQGPTSIAVTWSNHMHIIYLTKCTRGISHLTSSRHGSSCCMLMVVLLLTNFSCRSRHYSKFYTPSTWDRKLLVVYSWSSTSAGGSKSLMLTDSVEHIAL